MTTSGLEGVRYSENFGMLWYM